MIERYQEIDYEVGHLKRSVWPLVCAGLLVLGLALGSVGNPVYAQDPTEPPLQVTVEVFIPTPEPTLTPTPLPTVDPASVGYVDTGSTQNWTVPGVVEWETRDWDFGCPINIDTMASGPVRLCIVYTQITAWSMIGLSIPIWPFEAMLAVLVIAMVIRR